METNGIHQFSLCILYSLWCKSVAPILPLYFHDLGVQTPEAMSLWSGLANRCNLHNRLFGCSILGRVADKKGRKITLIRSSFGMALCNVLIAFQTTPEGVVLIRLIQGLVSGFYSASITLIASETPIERTGWAFRSTSFCQPCWFTDWTSIRWLHCRYSWYSQ